MAVQAVGSLRNAAQEGRLKTRKRRKDRLRQATNFIIFAPTFTDCQLLRTPEAAFSHGVRKGPCRSALRSPFGSPRLARSAFHSSFRNMATLTEHRQPPRISIEEPPRESISRDGSVEQMAVSQPTTAPPVVDAAESTERVDGVLHSDVRRS